MLRRLFWFAALAGLYALPFTRAAFGAEPTIVSIVTAAPPDAQEAASVRDGKVVYKIVKDTNGKKVAAEARGKKVEIKGPVKEIDGVKWMTVTSCKIVE